MWFWDEEIHNPYDQAFDFNGNGKLDPIERGIQIDYYYQEIEEDRRRSYEANNSVYDDPDDDF